MSTYLISTSCCRTMPPVSTTTRTTSLPKPRPPGKQRSAGRTTTQSDASRKSAREAVQGWREVVAVDDDQVLGSARQSDIEVTQPVRALLDDRRRLHDHDRVELESL